MIADHYLQLRSELETALAGLLKLGSEMRRPSSTLDTLHALLRDVRDPLLFVAVGEVKSGKSSLLNALFGQEFAKVDVLPATDRIYIFRYGTDEKSVEVSPQVTERYLPIPFLRDFNVVDTPGTNTMVSEHQTITENFVPRADLILFVFSVANPWTQSNWDFLGFVQKKWLKNVVFVLQQIDLREPTEIDVIHRHLQDTAMRKLGFVPSIYAVSARKALLARTSGLDKERLWRESDFGPLEEQINLIVSESSTRMLKLRSTAQTACVMLDEFAGDLRESLEVIARDEARLTRLDLLLQTRKEQTLRQVSGLVRGVEQACREAAVHGTNLLREKLSFWKTWKLIWSRKPWQHEFQLEIEKNLRQSVQPQVEHAVRLLEADLRGLWPQLHDMIDKQLAGELQAQVPKTIPDFSQQRRELLQSIQLALIERVAGKSVEEQLAQLFRETSARLRLPAGIAVAGGIVAAIAAMGSAAVADVTGVLAASAAAAGTLVAILQRRKILRAYADEMESKRSELVKTIELQLGQAIELFYKEVAAAFQPLAAFCLTQRRIYEPLLQRTEELQEIFADLKSRLA
ncbi:MAG TPA: dynamin family protein [Chthoniobacterales bacterium]|nr:dynamin family protein [Chthoniobacterales bacterium]